MNRLLLCCVLSLASTPALAEEAVVQPKEIFPPGKGVLLYYGSGDHSEEPPKTPVYDSAGKPIGQITWGNGSQYNSRGVKEISVNGSKVEVLRPKNVVEVGYEISAMVYFDSRDGRLQVLQKSHPQGVWLDPKDIKGRNEQKSWIQVLADSGGAWSGFDSYRVRAEPSLDGAVLTKLRDQDLWPGRSHQVSPTGKFKGAWVEVRVQEFKGGHWCDQGPDGEHPIGKPIVGWVKVADDNGQLPDIWYYTRGC